jgi:hypothetical protein
VPVLARVWACPGQAQHPAKRWTQRARLLRRNGARSLGVTAPVGEAILELLDHASRSYALSGFARSHVFAQPAPFLHASATRSGVSEGASCPRPGGGISARCGAMQRRRGSEAAETASEEAEIPGGMGLALQRSRSSDPLAGHIVIHVTA